MTVKINLDILEKLCPLEWMGDLNGLKIYTHMLCCGFNGLNGFELKLI